MHILYWLFFILVFLLFKSCLFMSIKVQNLYKSYGNHKVLKDISFEVQKGEIVGLLGVNGVGKSTLMKVLTSYYTATKGEVLVNGFSVENNLLPLRKSIGYLAEQNPLYPDWYITEYLEFQAQSYKLGSTKDRIKKVIEQTFLTSQLHQKIKFLSKGYKQRLGLAAALLHQPSVLILDEPTTGLDPLQMIDIRKLIKQEAQDKTVLLSTHLLSEVQMICDRVLILHNGCIAKDILLQDLDQDLESLFLSIVQ